MMNQAVLVGRLTRDLEVHETENGKLVSNITLAIPRPYKNEEGVYDTDFIDVKDMNFGLLSASDSINTFNTTYNRYEGRRVHNNDTVYVGQSILMPVPDEAATTSGHTSFQVNVMLRNTDGIAFPAEQPMDLQLKNYAAFKSGYTYRVILNIAGPRLVTLRAVLEPWKNAWEDENEQGFESLIFN